MDAESSSSLPGPPEGGPAAVGVIGLGDIGSGVAAGLVRAGADLVVCDIRPESTAAFAETARVASDPGHLGSLVDVVVIAVVTDEEVSDRLTPTPNAFLWIVDITDEAHPVPISTWG